MGTDGMNRRSLFLTLGLCISLCSPVRADRTELQPVTFGTGSSLTINSGITTIFKSGSITDFQSGAIVDFTGATVTGLAGGGAGLTDGDFGDITVSGTGTVMTLDAGAVTLAKMANMATASVLGRNTAGSGAPEVLGPSTVRTIIGVTRIFNVKDAAYGALGNGVANDLAAVNAAGAAALAAGGGVVYFPAGNYKISGSTWNATTNSLLTLPTTPGYGDVQLVEYVGETRGVINGATRAYISGTVLDFSAATGAGGTHPSAFAAAQYQEITPNTMETAKWVSVGVRFSRMTFVLPGDPDFGAINLHNVMQATVEDCGIFAMTTSGFVASDNPAAIGIIMPAHLNNEYLYTGRNRIMGFYDGMWAGEHQEFTGDGIAFCKNGLRIRHLVHPISGKLKINRCERVIVIDSAATICNFDLLLEAEVGDLGGDPYTPAGTFSGYYDVNGIGAGILKYSCLNLGSAHGALVHSDVAGVRFENLNDIDQFGASGTTAPTDYIAGYNFSTLNDQASTFNLTDHGTITFAAGKIGNGAVFNGTTQYGTNATLDLTSSDFTVCGWVKFAANQNTYIATQMKGALGNRWQLFIDTDESLKFSVIATSSPETTTGPLAADTWHFFAVTWNNTTGVQRIKANGGAWVTEAASGPMNTGGTTAVFAVGANEAGAAKLDGMLDGMRIYDRVLSDDEVTAIYNGGTGLEP